MDTSTLSKAMGNVPDVAQVPLNQLPRLSLGSFSIPWVSPGTCTHSPCRSSRRKGGSATVTGPTVVEADRRNYNPSFDGIVYWWEVD